MGTVSKNQVHDGANSPSTTAYATFEHSLRPLTLLLNLFGFWVPVGEKIDHYRCFSRYAKCAAPILLILSVFLLLADLLFYTVATGATLQSAKDIGESSFYNLTFAENLEATVDFINIAGFTTCIHFLFFTAVWLVPANWKRLCCNMQQIQRDLNLDETFYIRIRKIVWVSLFFLVIDVGYFLYPVSLSWHWYFWDGYDLPNIIFIIGMNLSRLIVSTILILFGVLTLSAAQMFYVLNKRVQSLIIELKLNGINGYSILASEIEKWREHHILVCQFVRWINHVFGVIILVTISHGFLAFVTTLFATIDCFKLSPIEEFKYTFLGIFLQHSSRLLLFIYPPHKLQIEVSIF